MGQTLRNLVHDMENEVTAIEAKVETLNDIRIAMNHLREDMDTAFHKGEQRFYFQEHHRQVRMLSELMHYVVKDMTEISEKATELQQSVFKIVVVGESEDEPQ